MKPQLSFDYLIAIIVFVFFFCKLTLKRYSKVKIFFMGSQLKISSSPNPNQKYTSYNK